MDNIFKKHKWIFFIVPLIVSIILFPHFFLIDFIGSFMIYALCGGWRFIRIFILTAPRDLRGLKVLLTLKVVIWNMKRRGHTIPDFFENTVDRYGTKTAFKYEDEIWSFTDVDAFANKVSNYLLRIHVRSGDVIALFMESRPAYVAIWIGISKIGAVPALINTNLRNESLLHCLNDANISGIICGSELYSALDAVLPKLTNSGCFTLILNGDISIVRSLNEITKTASSTVSMDTVLFSESNQRPQTLRHSTRKVTDALMYIFTSGTTGMPKAAKVSHVRYTMMTYGCGKMLLITSSDVIYNPLPLYHTAGGMVGTGQVLIFGATMAIRKRFSATNFWTDCIKYEATAIQYIGEICRYLLVQPQKPEETGHRVRLAFGNGIRPQIWTDFQDRFKIAQIGEFYGATESNCNIINSVNKVGAVGFGTRILPSMYPITLIKINEDTNEPMRDSNGICIQCEADEVGELVGKIHDTDPLRHFDGYVDTTASDKKVVLDVFRRGDRAFRTGDLLMQDELGFFYFRDRIGDTFRWKGENVSTSEVEAVISNCMQLNDCVVYGVDIPNNEGRAGMAAIAESDTKIESFSPLVIKLKSALPIYARPIFIRLCKNIEVTGTFKMKKTDLIKQGFNPSTISDNLYYYECKFNEYKRLSPEMYQQIIKGAVKF